MVTARDGRLLVGRETRWNRVRQEYLSYGLPATSERTRAASDAARGRYGRVCT